MGAYLIVALFALLAGALGAVLYRLRGADEWESATSLGGQAARVLCFAAPLAAISALILLALGGLPALQRQWWLPVSTFVLCWAGAALPQRGLNMGRIKGILVGGVWTEDAMSMLLRGIGWTWPVILPLFAAAPGNAALLAAAIAGPFLYVACYELGWRLHRVRQLGGTEWGELFFGAAIFSATVLLTWSVLR